MIDTGAIFFFFLTLLLMAFFAGIEMAFAGLRTSLTFFVTNDARDQQGW